MAVESLFHRVPCYIRTLLGQMEEIWHYAVLCGGRSLVFVNVSTWGAVVTAVVRHLIRLEAKEREADPGNIQPSVPSRPEALANAVSLSGWAQSDFGGKVQDRHRLFFQQRAVSTAMKGQDEPTCMTPQDIKLSLLVLKIYKKLNK